jgi:hypothetical protein
VADAVALGEAAGFDPPPEQLTTSAVVNVAAAIATAR